ncbi:MAG: tRNA (adenosine(37)-N6)-threonylcarbamoyltransferase complex dimerization subunit type 1 TsaB [Patescibacteria group bacterium]
MNKLIIDTTSNKKTTIKLQIDIETDEIIEESKSKSQEALKTIDKLLKKNNLKPQDIDEIEVNTGPGSFTGTRVGVAIANALGFGLGVKVNKKSSVTAKYV